MTGDVETEAQQSMLTARIDLHADILKVPHHGSAKDLPAFLTAVSPKVAVIGVGRDNDYGHPSPRTLAELQKVGAATILRTDTDGDVLVCLIDGPAVADGSTRGRCFDRDRPGCSTSLTTRPVPRTPEGVPGSTTDTSRAPHGPRRVRQRVRRPWPARSDDARPTDPSPPRSAGGPRAVPRARPPAPVRPGSARTAMRLPTRASTFHPWSPSVLTVIVTAGVRCAPTRAGCRGTRGWTTAGCSASTESDLPSRADGATGPAPNSAGGAATTEPARRSPSGCCSGRSGRCDRDRTVPLPPHHRYGQAPERGRRPRR